MSCGVLLFLSSHWTAQIRVRLHENWQHTKFLPTLYTPLTKLGIDYPEAVQILSGDSATQQAGRTLAEGSLVIIPTETVYGLGADAENADAVARVFAVKGRPTDHPLIVHLASAECIDAWAINIPDYARDLAAAYWPGPLTLVLQRSHKAKDFITGNQETVALRVPVHPLAREIIAELGKVKGDACTGIAAPSANRFGKVSPTSLNHAISELQDYLEPSDAGVDGGPADVGIESTIIDCTHSAPIVLRRGAITESDIEAIVALSEQESQVRAPGMLASHYAPSAKVQVIPSTTEIARLTPNSGLIALDSNETPANILRLASPSDEHEYARVLYSALRAADDNKCEVVYVIPPQGPGIAAAIRDRISRAAHDS